MNDYFNFDQGRLIPGDTARAEDVNAVFDDIAMGLDKLPSVPQLFSGSQNYAVATGELGNYNIEVPAITEYIDGMMVAFKASSDGGPSSLNVNDIGARPVVANDGSQLVPGDIVAGHIYTVRYNIQSALDGVWEVQRETAGEYAVNKVVAANIEDVKSVAANMEEVLEADTNAAIATAKASEAATSATEAANSASAAAGSAAALPNAVAIGAGLIPKVNPTATGWEGYDLGRMVPVGTIIPYMGGYFTSGANGGFVSVWGNDAASLNARFNEDGWYVCNGAMLNLSGSPFFDGVNRYLPNLTDSRFIMGSSTAGGVGGSNSVLHNHSIQHWHHVSDFDQLVNNTTLSVAQMPSHSHSISGGWAHSTGTGHGHVTGTATHLFASQTPNITSGGGGGAHNHLLQARDIVTGDPANTNYSGDETLENRPQFLTCLYLMRVK